MTATIPRGLLLAAAAALAGCASSPGGSDITTAERTARIVRTTHGVPHISAPDLESLAYGVAYAHAQDNVCMTAQQLVTVRGQRARWFGNANALFGLRALPNEQIDFYVAAQMDDAALDRIWARASADAQALGRGYVAGYNRFLADQAGRLPAACNGQPWVQPMTVAEWRRLAELTSTQAGIAALADAVLAPQPPAAKAATAPVPAPAPAVD
ncbi:MAG: penicillin acylase family protein, partial [Rubrivivax sp.]